MGKNSYRAKLLSVISQAMMVLYGLPSPRNDRTIGCSNRLLSDSSFGEWNTFSSRFVREGRSDVLTAFAINESISSREDGRSSSFFESWEEDECLEGSAFSVDNLIESIP